MQKKSFLDYLIEEKRLTKTQFSQLSGWKKQLINFHTNMKPDALSVAQIEAIAKVLHLTPKVVSKIMRQYLEQKTP